MEGHETILVAAFIAVASVSVLSLLARRFEIVDYWMNYMFRAIITFWLGLFGSVFILLGLLLAFLTPGALFLFFAEIFK